MNSKKKYVWALIVCVSTMFDGVCQASWYKKNIDYEIIMRVNKSAILFRAISLCSEEPKGGDWYVSENERLPVVIDLLAAGANPNFRNWYDDTCLYCATRHNFCSIVKALLLAGADPNIKGCGRTALYSASVSAKISLEKMTQDALSDFYKRLNIIKTLLTAGASLDIVTCNLKTAEDIVKQLGIDHTLYKPNLTYKIRQVAYQKYIQGDSSMLHLLLGLDTKKLASIQAMKAMQGKARTLDHAIHQNRKFFKDVLDEPFWQKAGITFEKEQ